MVKIFPGTLGGGEVYVCRQRVRSAMLGREFLNVRNYSEVTGDE
ncbi:MAG: hypothetical protein WKF84_22980 [Pyrinomonadaceae bacterium]